MTGLEKMVERITGEARAAADIKVEEARSQAAVILEDTEKETKKQIFSSLIRQKSICNLTMKQGSLISSSPLLLSF